MSEVIRTLFWLFWFFCDANFNICTLSNNLVGQLLVLYKFEFLKSWFLLTHLLICWSTVKAQFWVGYIKHGSPKGLFTNYVSHIWGVWTPLPLCQWLSAIGLTPILFLSAIFSIWETPPPPFFQECHHLDTPPPSQYFIVFQHLLWLT